MSRLHFSISTTFRPSTANKGKQQGCYHGEKSQDLVSQRCKISESSASGVIQRGSQLSQAASALPRAGAAKARDLGNPQEFSAANADNSHSVLIHWMAITSRLFLSSRQLFWCLQFSALEHESEEILSKKKPLPWWDDKRGYANTIPVGLEFPLR